MSRLPTPSEIMRAKRPYLYSDSECTNPYRISESELSHHLDTITDRNQHKDFEVFCRKLCERELCPNLRPQTGPEGGGDGKVDTETYPVDERISERWYIGDGKSGAERWGFAFSAKKEWSAKVRSDVKGIVGTERGYHRIIFFTNRPARQRDRLRIEDELYQEFGVRVTIYDREWIIDRVFSHDHKDLAHEYLKVGLREFNKIKLGPRDFKRQQELDVLESGLKKLGSTAQDQIQAISDTFEAARLSRELERPRFETEGRFKRAIDHAKKYGANYQHLRAVYEYAWTAFWWFDDIETMQSQYEQVEAIAFASERAVHIGKVCNLHQLLAGRVLHGYETPEELSFVDRSRRLEEKLIELAADKSRPNNALHAETLLVLHRMSAIALSEGRASLDEIWLSLCGIIDRAEGLAEFPADLLESIVDAISESLPDSQAFDILVEKLAEFMAGRSAEIKAGMLYFQQGELKLKAEKPVDGIKWLGRAVIHLSKDESREDQAKSLYYLAVGYHGAGLRWAARATALASIIQYLALSETEGDFRSETIPALNLFAMLSLQLGHILDVLSAIRFLQAIVSNAPLNDESGERLKKQLVHFDQLLACLLVIQQTEEIRRLQSLPDVLDGLGLYTARMALLYRLGYIDSMRADGSIPQGTDDHEISEMMSLLASQRACSSLPDKVVLFDELFGGVQTKILGVTIQIEVSNTLEGVLQSETFAAAFEGFAATLLKAIAFPHTERFTVRIEQLDNILDASIDENDDAAMRIYVPADWRLTEISGIGKYNERLILSCIQVLLNIATMRNAERAIEDLAKTENVFKRATLFCRAGISRTRVFGTHVGRISDWDDVIKRTFPMMPDSPAKPKTTERPSIERNDEEDVPQTFGEIRSHDDVVVRAIINSRLWGAAGWKGMSYCVIMLGQPPFLGLMFANAQKGVAVFKDWLARFGNEDRNDEIYISAIKGIDRKNPYHYRCHITQNFSTLSGGARKKFFNISQMHTMTVDNHRNLEMFCEHLKTCGVYFLVPTVFDDSGSPKILFELAIRKKSFQVRDAWNIGPHDIDALAVRPDDDVIIPNGEISPPVYELAKSREK